MKVTAEEESYYRWVMIIAPGGSAIVASLMLAFILLTKHRRTTSPSSIAGGASSQPSQSSPAVTFSSSTQSLLSSGPCSPHDWDHTTASALQGVRGVAVKSPMTGREEEGGGEWRLGETTEGTERTPLLSASFTG